MQRFDKLTLKVQEALQAAQEIAARHEQQQIEPVHVLVALVEQREGIVPPLLTKLGVRAETLTSEIETAVARLPKVTGVAEQYLSPASHKVLRRAFDEAAKFKDEFVSTEHLLLAIAALPIEGAGEILARHGITPDAILQVLATASLFIVAPLGASATFMSWFSTHPPLERRIAALRNQVVTR